MDFPGRSWAPVVSNNPVRHHRDLPSVFIDIPKSQRRMLHRVPGKMLQDKKHIYEPAVVSLGPYHHRRKDSQLEMVEPFKDELRDMLCGDRKSSLLSKIKERIPRIRYFYGMPDDHTDEELAEMMLRDACFLICFMHGFGKHGLKTYIQMCERMGRSAMLSVLGEIFMLENQIPLWLISLIYPQHQTLLCEYLSYNFYGDHKMTQLPWTEEDEEPLHLLEALHRTFLCLGETKQNSSPLNKSNQPTASTTAWQRMNSLYWPVTDLKAKGIHLRGSSHCLTDIKFLSFGVFSSLHLPIYFVSEDSKVLFSNLIALEMSPGIDTDFGVTSYINFMKTLINDVNDVKVLREKGILSSTLESNQEVLDIFKSIDTYGFSSIGLFYDVKMRIDKHCNSKAMTFAVELINAYFQRSWSLIGPIALFLTLIQTYYTINPRS